MKKCFQLLVVLALLDSCATIINSPFQRVNIDHAPGLKVRIDSSQFSYRESQVYNVFIPKDYTRQSTYFLRCKNEIPLIINNSDTIKIKPHRSYFAYWFANIYTSYGLGMLIDYPNDKSFEYPRYIYIDKVNDKFKNIRFKPIPEKKINFTLSFPSFNFFYLQSDSGKISFASLLGISVGLEYFFKNNTYLSLSAGATMDLFSANRDTINENYFKEFGWGFNEYSSSRYLNIRINKITPSIEYGVGMTLTKLKWSANNRIELTDSTHISSQSYYNSLNLGLSGNLRYRLTPNLSIGIFYQPLFFDFKHQDFKYQHFISTEFVFRF